MLKNNVVSREGCSFVGCSNPASFIFWEFGNINITSSMNTTKINQPIHVHGPHFCEHVTLTLPPCPVYPLILMTNCREHQQHRSI